MRVQKCHPLTADTRSQVFVFAQLIHTDLPAVMRLVDATLVSVDMHPSIRFERVTYDYGTRMLIEQYCGTAFSMLMEE